MSVASSVNRLAAPLRSSSRRSFNWRPARAPSVRACPEAALLERLGRLANVLAALLDLLSGVGHPFAVFLSFHALLNSSVSRRICCC